MPADEHELPPKLAELLDELDQEVRGVPTARVLGRRGVSVQLVIHTVEGLKQLVNGDREQAARTFEAVVEEIRDRTMSLD